jgi:predicted ArsR family transcriptional regulator
MGGGGGSRPGKAEPNAGPGQRRARLAVAANPGRVAILSTLQLNGPLSAAELAGDLGRPVESVRHQLRQLLNVGLLERERRKRGGRAEFVYRSDPRQALITSRELAEAPIGLLKQAETRLLRIMFREATGAIEAGAFDGHEHAAVRLVFPLDEPTLSQVERIMAGLLETAFGITESAAKRLRGSSTPPIFTALDLLSFEVVKRPWPDPTPFETSAIPARRASHRNQADSILSVASSVAEKILEVLNVEPAGVAELAERIDVPADRIRYHLRQLQRVGMIRKHSSRPRRGVIERVYIGDSRAQLLKRSDIVDLDDARLRFFGRSAVAMLFRDALEAARNGALLEAERTFLTRMPLRLDEEGFRQISEENEAAIARLLDLREECLRDLEREDRKARVGTVGILFFKLS